MLKRTIEQLQLHPSKLLAWGFFSLIMIGALLLSLPFVTTSGQSVGFINALFTATSCVCVTGLVVVNTFETWNLAGQIIIILLIQAGGLGIMTTVTILTFVAGRKISLKNRLIMKESLAEFGISGVVRLTKQILFTTFLIEGLGAFSLAFSFVPKFGWLKGLWFSVFHSISAFCNAGFDLLSANSLKPVNDQPSILIPISLLIILGGLGFTVILDLARTTKHERLSIHSRFVLLITGLLLIFGMVFFFISEYDNPLSIGKLDLSDKLVNAWFQSVTPRTAGYSSVDQWTMKEPSQVVTEALMFIGGSPGSTAGGIKTATFGLLIFMVISVLKGQSDTIVFRRKIPKDIVNRALTIFVISIALMMLAFLLLTITETPIFDEAGQRINTMDRMLFELFSAYATVGLTAGITPLFSIPGKLVLIAMMFLGRVGPMTLLTAIAIKSQEKNLIHYPEGRISIG